MVTTAEASPLALDMTRSVIDALLPMVWLFGNSAVKLEALCVQLQGCDLQLHTLSYEGDA